jgi:hypothetical protein
LPAVQAAVVPDMADRVKHFYQQELAQLDKAIPADTAVIIMALRKAHTTAEVVAAEPEHRDIIVADDMVKLAVVKDKPVVSAVV